MKRCRSVRGQGFTLVELLCALALVLLLASTAGALVAWVGRIAVTQPVAADQQQRLRAAMIQIGAWVSAAGQGVRGVGVNDGALLLPPLYPQRRGVEFPDGEAEAFPDRLTILAGTDPPAFALVGAGMASRSEPLPIDPAGCAPGRVACGFETGATMLVADATASGEWFTVSRASAGFVEHVPATLSRVYGPARGATATLIDVRALVYDARQRQVRLVGPGSNLPLLDGVAEFTVQWFGDPRPPQGPVPPAGESNCVVDADGGRRLGTLPGAAAPWIELTVASLADGPWCGQVPWRFDADLLRVRLLRVRLRLDRPPPPVSGDGDTQDPVVDVEIAPRNLLRFR